MPGCSPLQVTPSSGKVQALFPQTIEGEGLNSRSGRPRAATVPTRPALPTPSRAADFAGRNAAAAWHQRYREWMEANVPPRASADLFAQLPFEDAVKLAALVGTGRMTWQEVNAALNVMIKLAAVDAFDGQAAEHHPRLTRRVAAQIAEDEIWARYHAQCDGVFASDANPTDADQQSPEQLWRMERILDCLRSVRDRDLAVSRRRLGAQARQPVHSAITLKPIETALPWTHLSPAESAALHKLDATGFVGSAGMIATIDDLVSEVTEDRSR